MTGLPTPEEIKTKIQNLIEGRETRSDVSAWATSFFSDDEDDQGVQFDPRVWEVLTSLGAADLIGIDRPYLFGVDDFKAWADELNTATDNQT